MKPEIWESWEMARGDLKEAYSLLASGDPHKAKEKAFSAVVYGLRAMRSYEDELTQSLSIGVEFMFGKEYGRMSASQAVNEAKKRLNKIREFLPQEDYVPEF